MIENSEASNPKGESKNEQIHLGVCQIFGRGSNLCVSIPRKYQQYFGLKSGELIELILIRKGITVPKSRRAGSPLLRKKV